MLKIKLLSILFFITYLGLAQVEEVEPPEYIKTISFLSNSNQSELPILKLNERILLEFDVLTANEEDYYYTIEHYNYDWTPSKLIKSEYLQGMDNLRIVNYENSFNTYQIYSNYRLQIPNSQTRLKISGNYMLHVYDDYGDLMFSRKFMVYEELSAVAIQIKRSRNITYINEKQSVDFSIRTSDFRFNNPQQNVRTLIIQNNNLKTAISGLQPQYTMGNELIYRYNEATSFWGGNEYLYFENKDVRGTNLGVEFIDLQDVYHSYLYLDQIRSSLPYTYNPDINGNFVTTVLNRTNPSIEADYTVVHFGLILPPTSYSVFVYGNFNNYTLNTSNQMYYNEERGLYELELILKQGFYNYKYVVVDNQGELIEGAISGNFYETENNYKVLVYYRDLGARYDRIVGYGETDSTQISN